MGSSLRSRLAKRYPATVIMLDLASAQIAGATMAEISTVLYWTVMQWAGQSLPAASPIGLQDPLNRFTVEEPFHFLQPGLTPVAAPAVLS